jgi:hypothetical protein
MTRRRSAAGVLIDKAGTRRRRRAERNHEWTRMNTNDGTWEAVDLVKVGVEKGEIRYLRG